MIEIAPGEKQPFLSELVGSVSPGLLVYSVPTVRIIPSYAKVAVRILWIEDRRDRPSHRCSSIVRAGEGIVQKRPHNRPNTYTMRQTIECNGSCVSFSTYGLPDLGPRLCADYSREARRVDPPRTPK